MWNVMVTEREEKISLELEENTHYYIRFLGLILQNKQLGISELNGLLLEIS